MPAPVESDAPATAVIGAIAARSAASVPPRSCPNTRTWGAEVPVSSAQMRYSPSGPCGARRCHAATAAPACDQGKSQNPYAAELTGWVASSRAVTTPKLPPPPPRQAQRRSGFVTGSAVTTRPSAVTIRTERMLSQVAPNARAANPTPPPSARPEIPTVGHDPVGTARPLAASAVIRSIASTPAPTVTERRSAATPIASIRRTSHTSPWFME